MRPRYLRVRVIAWLRKRLLQDDPLGHPGGSLLKKALAVAVPLALLAGLAFGIGALSDTSGSGGTRAAGADCDPSYPEDCLDPDAEDYDCEGGTGDGPRYVAGPVTVDRDVDDPDPFDLDRDGDGLGCDS